MRISKGSLKLIACLFAITVMMAVSATPSEAFIIDGCKTGMIGITDGQTLRVNVANVGSSAVAYQAWFRVFDAMGNLVAEFKSDRVLAGTAASFDLNRDDIVDSRGRLELRVETELEVPDDANIKRVRDSVRITVEVFDNATGKTEVFINNPND